MILPENGEFPPLINPPMEESVCVGVGSFLTCVLPQESRGPDSETHICGLGWKKPLGNECLGREVGEAIPVAGLRG